MSTSRNEQTYDVANYSAASHMALQHLKAAGIPAPENKLREIYADLCPDGDDFVAEVKSFEKDFVEATHKSLYLGILAENCTEDPKEYARKYDAGMTEEGRLREGGAKYVGQVNFLPKFEPTNIESYLARSGNLPDHIHQSAYVAAFEYAKAYMTKSIA